MKSSKPAFNNRLLRRRPRAAQLGAVAFMAIAVIAGVTVKMQSQASSSFITRSNHQLMLDGKPFRFSGTNIYWLGLDENIRDAAGNYTYPTHYRIDNAMTAAVNMQARVVRAHTLGVSVGCPQCIEPQLGQFNHAAFEPIDYAIASAKSRGLRLMIPLTDQWHYYHGGKHTFTSWRGYANLPGDVNAGNSDAQKAVEAHFYTDPQVIEDYKAYIWVILNHVNQYTGVALKDDPTIMAWETGNELFDAPPAWTDQIATYTRWSAGAKQLVADGSAASNNHVTGAALASQNIDIVGGHFYNWPSGLDNNWIAADAAVARANNKAYVVGEWAWSRTDRTPFLRATEANQDVAGDLTWATYAYKEDGTPVPHGSTTYGDDDVALYYPGKDATMQAGITALAEHGRIMALELTASVDEKTTSGTNKFAYAGTWQDCGGCASNAYQGSYKYSGATNATATLTFTGTRAAIWGYTEPKGGIAAVSIDGGPAVDVDYYAPSSNQGLRTMFATPVLAHGQHTVKFTVTGRKSLGTSPNINLDRADIYASPVLTPAPTPTPTPTPTAAPTPTPTPTPLAASPGLTGAYHAGKGFAGQLLTSRTDPTVNFNWAGGAPLAGVPADNFSVRWTGKVTAPSSGTYTFGFNGDDGYRVYVNGTLVIDRWVDQGATYRSGTINLTGGQSYAITVEYYERGGQAVAQLYWTGPGIARQIIPSSRLVNR